MIKKKRLLFELHRKIKKLKNIYLKKANTYRRLNTANDIIVIGSGTVATMSLIMSLSIVGSPLIIVSLVASGISTVSSAFSRATKIQLKHELFKTAYLSLADLQREIHLTITKTLTEREIDMVIADISDRIGLVTQAVTVVSISSKDLTISPTRHEFIN